VRIGTPQPLYKYVKVTLPHGRIEGKLPRIGKGKKQRQKAQGITIERC
jgi:hypothetical protein